MNVIFRTIDGRVIPIKVEAGRPGSVPYKPQKRSSPRRQRVNNRRDIKISDLIQRLAAMVDAGLVDSEFLEQLDDQLSELDLAESEVLRNRVGAALGVLGIGFETWEGISEGRSGRNALGRAGAAFAGGWAGGWAGSVAGAKVGAAVGSVIPGLGTVTGGAFGGILGSIGAGIGGAVAGRRGFDNADRAVGNTTTTGWRK